MAKVVTLQILVDAESGGDAENALNELLGPLKDSFRRAGKQSASRVIDFKLTDGNDELYATPVLAEVDAAISDETYVDGQAFRAPDNHLELPNGHTYNIGAESLWLNATMHGKSTSGVTLYINRDFHGVTVNAYKIGREMDPPRAVMHVEFGRGHG